MRESLSRRERTATLSKNPNVIQMTETPVPLAGGRRQFLLASAMLAAGTISMPALRAAQSNGESNTQSNGVLLTPSGKDLFRVRIELELEGNVHVPKNALASRKSAVTLPIKSDAKLDYEERFRRPPGTDSGEVTTIERYYHDAVSSSVLNRNQHVGKLRDSVRSAIVRRELLPEVIYATDDYFHRSELELLRLPISSVAVEQLLPAERVEVGSIYAPNREAMVSVLNLTSVEASDVTAEVVALTQQEARIQFKGKVDGSVEGVPTEIRTIGKLTFDRQMGICTWLAIAIHETREIGIAEPGFDIAATLKMVRQPLDQPIALASPPEPVDVTAPLPQDRLYVELVSERLGFSTLTDRRWRMMSDVPGAAMMRMIDSDRSIAQCDVRSLATLRPGSQWTLEAFQQDVKRTLGEQLTELIEAEEFLSPVGLRVLRVVAQGSVQGVPIQWVMLHFSDDSGRRLLGTFTMEGHNVATFAGADTQLASTLRFLETSGGSDQTPGSAPEPGAGAESADKQVARSNRSVNANDEVQSASDLR